MKRRLISLVLVMILCLSLTGNAFALSSGGTVVQPKSSISVTCGLYKSGSQYKVWSTTETSLSSSLTARASLYKVVTSGLQYVTAVSISGTGTSLTASKLLALTSGTYKVYGYGTSNSSSSSNNRTIVVP